MKLLNYLNLPRKRIPNKPLTMKGLSYLNLRKITMEVEILLQKFMLRL